MSDRHAKPVRVRPFAVKHALRFVSTTHRRLPRLQGGMWAVAAEIDGQVVGVAIVGRPQARMADDGVSLELTRCAVIEGARNACSALYGSAARAAKAMGAADLWTMVHGDESGHSLKAAGWVRIGACGGGNWSRQGRLRLAPIDGAEKVKWVVAWGRQARSVPGMAKPAFVSPGASSRV